MISAGDIEIKVVGGNRFLKIVSIMYIGAPHTSFGSCKGSFLARCRR
ncbi:MAG: hypothetical protein BMS9Abin39_0780 [Ignavibacteria bacterium]|nr:MAG: hypothetical protein BMS9Abin39_0780 [Ignavibacteria bacterium]